MTSFFRASTVAAEPIHQPVDPVIPTKGPNSLGIDASISTPDALSHRPVLRSWAETRDEWRAQITAEQLVDVEFYFYRTATMTDESSTRIEGLSLRPTDGAVIRKPGADALAYTDHAWRQLVNVLMQEIPNKPRAPADALRWLSPVVRAQAFNDLKLRSRRAEGIDSPLLMRSFIDPRYGVRALRAVVSGRHSGKHFDDLALSNVFDRIISKTARDSQAYVVRGVNLTLGHVVLDAVGDVSATLAFRNSEVGGSSIEFSGGCYVRALDAVIHRASGVGVDRDVDAEATQVNIASEQGRHRRAHTLPRKGISEAQRGEIASARMEKSIALASASARSLCEAWRDALTTFAPDWVRGESVGLSREGLAEVLLDLVEQYTKIEEDDREALRRVIVDETRLTALPFGSAAQIAGAWAILASKAGEFEEAVRLRDNAAKWITVPFGTKWLPKAPAETLAA